MKKMETTNDTYADTLTMKKMETTNDIYGEDTYAKTKLCKGPKLCKHFTHYERTNHHMKNENICSVSGTPKSPYHALTMTYLNNANHDVLPTDKPVGRTTYLALIIS